MLSRACSSTELTLLSMADLSGIPAPFGSAATPMQRPRTPLESLRVASQPHASATPSHESGTIVQGRKPHSAAPQPRPPLPPPPPPSRHSTPAVIRPSSLTGQACVAALLDSTGEVEGATASSTDCLGLLAPVRHTHNIPLEQQRWWEEHDVRIDVPLPQAAQRADAGIQLTNPSVLCRRGRLLLAARAMWPVAVQPPCTDVWRSHTILTSIAYDAASHTLGPALHADARADANGSAATGTVRACVADLTDATSVPPSAPGEGVGGASAGGAGMSGSSVGSGSAQAERCARQGLAPSVGLGSEDPRLFDHARASAALAAGLHVTLNVAKRPTDRPAPSRAHAPANASAPYRAHGGADYCASTRNRRAMALQALEPQLGVPVTLHWPPAASASDRNWVREDH